MKSERLLGFWRMAQPFPAAMPLPDSIASS